MAKSPRYSIDSSSSSVDNDSGSSYHEPGEVSSEESHQQASCGSSHTEQDASATANSEDTVKPGKKTLMANYTLYRTNYFSKHVNRTIHMFWLTTTAGDALCVHLSFESATSKAMLLDEEDAAMIKAEQGLNSRTAKGLVVIGLNAEQFKKFFPQRKLQGEKQMRHLSELFDYSSEWLETLFAEVNAMNMNDNAGTPQQSKRRSSRRANKRVMDSSSSSEDKAKRAKPVALDLADDSSSEEKSAEEKSAKEKSAERTTSPQRSQKKRPVVSTLFNSSKQQKKKARNATISAMPRQTLAQAPASQPVVQQVVISEYENQFLIVVKAILKNVYLIRKSHKDVSTILSLLWQHMHDKEPSHNFIKSKRFQAPFDTLRQLMSGIKPPQLESLIGYISDPINPTYMAQALFCSIKNYDLVKVTNYKPSQSDHPVFSYMFQVLSNLFSDVQEQNSFIEFIKQPEDNRVNHAFVKKYPFILEWSYGRVGISLQMLGKKTTSSEPQVSYHIHFFRAASLALYQVQPQVQPQPQDVDMQDAQAPAPGM